MIFLLCFLLYIFYISVICLLYFCYISAIFLFYFCYIVLYTAIYCYISTIFLLYFYYISAILLLYLSYISAIHLPFLNFCNISAIFKSWKSDFRKGIKVRLLTALIESLFLYGSETWTLTIRLNKVLDGCYTRFLRMALNVTQYRDRFSNAEQNVDLPRVSFKVRQKHQSYHCPKGFSGSLPMGTEAEAALEIHL